MPVLEGQGVCKFFGGLAAVSNVDFSVEEGEVLGLIGPNGAGKTTLFNCISGALPVDRGTITFKGDEISGMKPFRICRMGLARTFQTAKVFRHLPIVENVALGAMFGRSRVERSSDPRAETGALLEFVGLGDCSQMATRDLTLVGQKRLEVARALATKPEVLLLDELMAGLNHTEVEEAMQLVHNIRARGITVVMIEHVMSAVMGVCGRIMVLHHGEKIADGKPEEIATNKTVVEVYLGE